MSEIMDYLAAQDAAAGRTSAMDTTYTGVTGEDGSPVAPTTPSYLVGADNHQVGNTGSSIFDPTTWGDRADNAYKFSVSALTRAVSSTYNSAIQVGSILGIADDSDKADTSTWLHGMDDDLGQYYDKNQSSVDTVGDFIGMFAPGLGGVKVLNWAQKGIELATDGRAGLNLAYHFGTLPTKQAMFAEQAAADVASTSNPFTLINSSLTKSLIAGYAQSSLEGAAFNVAAAVTMQDSPLFKDEDWKDIAYNAMLGGGFIGAGVMGTSIAARTIMDIKKAGNAVDAATHAWSTVLTEPAAGTPASERLAIHLNNIEAIPTVGADDPLAILKNKKAASTAMTENDNGRLAAQALTGNDSELGNTLYDVISQGDSEDVAQKMVALNTVSRAGVVTNAEKELGDAASPTYFKLMGEDAGTIVDSPAVLSLADKSKSEADVLATVKSYGHKQGQDWEINSANGDADAVEARYIAAQEATFKPDVKVGVNDIPFLEAGYKALVEDNNLAGIQLKDGSTLDKSALLQHLTTLKTSTALQLQAQNAVAVGEPALNTAAIAKLVNVKASYLQGTKSTVNPLDDLMAMQATAKDYTNSQIAARNWKVANGQIKTYLKPQYGKFVYDSSKADELPDMMETRGMVALKQQQALYKQDANNVFANFAGERTPLFTDIPGSVLMGANRESVGGGLFSSMNGNYNTLASWTQHIGGLVSDWISKKVGDTAETLNPAGHKLLTDPEAGTEFWKTLQQLRQTSEKYSPVYVTEAETNRRYIGSLENIKSLQYKQDVSEAQNALLEANSSNDAAAVKLAEKNLAKVTANEPVYEDKEAPVSIPLKTQGMQEFADTWHTLHKQHRMQQMNLRNSQGYQVANDADNFYIPPVDVRAYPHFAFVRDTSPTATGHISTIHAASAADLEALTSKVPTDQGLEVIYKDDSERFHKAMQDYEYDLGINENYINSALKRSGVSGSFFPQTDVKNLYDGLMTFRNNQDSNLIREMVSHRYNTEVAELQRQGKQFALAENSRVGYTPAILKKTASNPFNDYVNTMMGRSREGSTPIWSAINRLAETSVSSLVNKLQSTWDKTATPQDLDAVNEVLKSIGVNTYQDAATLALANHAAPKPVLAQFIRRANSILTFTMLKSDPLNAINNGLGHTVLYGAEMNSLIKDILGTGKSPAAGEFKSLAQINLPGTDSWVTSPTKLAAKAYSNWFSKVLGKEDGGKLAAKYDSLGLLPTYTDEFRSMLDSGTLNSEDNDITLSDRIKSMLASAKNIDRLATKYSGNGFIEQMNRFVSADAAHSVTQVAIKHGLLAPEMEASVINTFVNRVEGNMRAAQRPLLFRGPVGQALGLFQTYQFNMLQQLFRHIGEGNTKSTAILLGLQGSIYGMNGLPAFNAINNYIVGNRAGPKPSGDIVSNTYNTVGQEAGDWLLYGLSSNMMLAPDAKVNLYSRGDINPRQVTVIPTQLSDVPIVGAATKFFGSMYNTINKMQQGGNNWSVLLQGIEHSGISRPLAGFAQAMEASTNPGDKVFSTDSKGNIVMQNDLFSAMTAARLLGAKPLDEAKALDAIHRVQVYSQARQEQLNTLGSTIKATIAGGNIPTQDQINQFIGEYTKAGGDQQHFSQWYNTQTLAANQSKVNTLIEHTNNPYSNYMQRIMGGYELKDFNNSQPQLQGTGGN